MNKEDKAQLVNFIENIFVFTSIFVLIWFSVTSYIIPVAVYSDDSDTLYGYSSLFQRFINTNYIKVINLSTFNYTTQNYEHQWTSIVTHSNSIYWFYDGH